MRLTFLPATDAALLQWSLNFSTRITATPTAYGLVAAQATAYAAAQTAFNTAYTAAIEPSTRTAGTIAAKNTARANLKAISSSLGKIVDATQSVTNQQRRDLGLNVRSAPSPIPPPSSAPGLDVLSVSGVTATIRLHDSTSGSKRGKPPGTIGASVFSFVGAAAPGDISAWKFEGSTGRVAKIDITFDSSLAAGTKVWFCAFWFNGRKQSGPACAPVSTNLPGGSVSMAA